MSCFSCSPCCWVNPTAVSVFCFQKLPACCVTKVLCHSQLSLFLPTQMPTVTASKAPFTPMTPSSPWAWFRGSFPILMLVLRAKDSPLTQIFQIFIETGKYSLDQKFNLSLPMSPGTCSKVPMENLGTTRTPPNPPFPSSQDSILPGVHGFPPGLWVMDRIPLGFGKLVGWEPCPFHLPFVHCYLWLS